MGRRSRHGVVAVVLVGCGFNPPHANGDSGGNSDVAPRDSSGSDAQLRLDAALDASIAFCDHDDPSLLACYEFEDTTNDGSVNHLDPDIIINATYGIGKVGQALIVGDTTEVDVAENSLFGVSALTIEAWIDLNQIPPAGGRAGLLDCDGRYGLFVYSNGTVQCTAGGTVATPIQANQWEHVACTTDGTTIKVYIDGSLAATATGGPLSMQGSQTGITLGGNNPPGGGNPLDGSLDQVRLFNVARSAQQICADAGLTNC